MAWMKTKIRISPSLKPADRVSVSESIIEYIKNRTLDGIDKNLEKFPDYKQKYADFKGVGVDEVDLVFSGQMLEDLKLISHKSGELTIGFENGSESNGKAEGNIKGTYGQSRPVSAPRDFLGISSEELEILIDTIGEESFEGLSDSEIDKIARDAARELLGDIEFDE